MFRPPILLNYLDLQSSDIAKIAIGDVDGDGRRDVVANVRGTLSFALAGEDDFGVFRPFARGGLARPVDS